MKGKFLALLLVMTTIATVFVGCGKEKNEELETVRLNEVVHSIFYVPQYVAMEKGFFEEEGIKIELSVGQGADKSMTALISDNADIALLGTEAGIYVVNEGKENYPKAFLQLTQRAGNFLVSRQKEENFKWENLKGKTLIGGRNGGMPQMVLEYILNKNSLSPDDIEMITNLDFTTTAGAYAAGTGDYTVEFEPSAYNLEKEGKGYVVASLGVDSGIVPYTVYMANDSYLKEHSDTVQGFTNAIYKAQQWVETASSKEIAEVIKPHFTDNSIEDLEKIIERYKQQDTWTKTPVFDEEAFNLIQDIMDFSGELSQRVPFEKLVDNSFAEKAIE